MDEAQHQVVSSLFGSLIYIRIHSSFLLLPSSLILLRLQVLTEDSFHDDTLLPVQVPPCHSSNFLSILNTPSSPTDPENNPWRYLHL